MHHFISRAACIICAVLCFCGCAKGGSAGINIETVSYETDKSTVYIERPAFNIYKNAELSDTLTDLYSSQTDSALVAFDTAAAEATDIIDGNKCIFEMHTDIKYNENDFISVLNDTYTYLGGAHGQSVWMAKNIDTLTGEEIKLEDLFSDKGYIETLNRLISEEVEEHPEEYSDLWERPKIKESNQTDFYISDEGLTVFYQPYDLSYYARGMVEFGVEFEDISGYMKEEYRRLFDEAKQTP